MYEKTKRLIEDQICPAGTDRPEYPSSISNHTPWSNQLKHEYDSAIRQKNTEIQQWQKNGIKDSIQVAYREMGDIHMKYGFTVSAISLWERAYDGAAAPQEQLKMSLKIMKTSFIGQNAHFFDKYCERAMS